MEPDVSAAGEAGANVNQAKTSFLAGRSMASIGIPWHTTQWDWVEYEFDIWAEGAINLEP